MKEAAVEKARELGRVLGQLDEYRAVVRARQRLEEDQEAMSRARRLDELEREIAQVMQKGEEPTSELASEYEKLFSELQANSSYQGIVAAQMNFDRILARVNEEISKGIEAGAESRIILPH
jgi:cell fate (sporulation/competence/biofilm development) regulator YlbF (YheA/YmcA/DUF963 family)